MGVTFGTNDGTGGGGTDPIKVFAVAIASGLAAGVPDTGVRLRGTIGAGPMIGGGLVLGFADVAVAISVAFAFAWGGGGPVPTSVCAFDVFCVMFGDGRGGAPDGPAAGGGTEMPFAGGGNDGL